MSDVPIANTSGDLFGHSRVAKRIADRLREPQPPSQAVVGALGSGKTTLRNLVENTLGVDSSADNVRIVHVELWKFENSRAAVEAILRSLIDAIAVETSAIGLRGLPSIYADAMTAAGGTWSALSKLQGIASVAPDESLRRIDRVASAAGLRLVLWIEDLERFAGAQPHHDSEPETAQEAERLAPIRALLHALDSLAAVSVVTATTSLRVRVDLEKIARYVEEVPRLPEELVSRVLASFRAGCRAMLKSRDAIDPADPAIRKELDQLAEGDESRFRRALFGSRRVSLVDALTALVTTPRALKYGLRKCLDTWGRLAGEIDVDDLLTISLIRVSSPDAFAAIRDHLPYLRVASRRPAEYEREQHEAARQAWERSISAASVDPAVRPALMAAIGYIFNAQAIDSKPQGFAAASPVDYWTRYLAEEPPGPADSDQFALQAIVSDDDSAVLALLDKPSTAALVEKYSRMMPDERVLGLLPKLSERRSGEHFERWRDAGFVSVFGGTEVAGVVPLWRMWLRMHEQGRTDPRACFDFVSRAIRVSLPRSLQVALEIEHYFVAAGEERQMLRGSRFDFIPTAKTELRALLRDNFVGRPAELVRALDGTNEWALQWLAWGLDRVRAGDFSGLPFDGWNGFAATMLDALRMHPDVMASRVAPLVVRDRGNRVERGGVRAIYAFDFELADRLFGGSAAVLNVFAEIAPAVRSMAPVVVAVYEAVHAIAEACSRSRFSDQPQGR